MKRFLLYSLGLGLAAIISSCGGDDPLPRPSASFLQDRVYIEIGESITFTSTSAGATIFEWDFGDGQTSMEQNPIINFDDEGEYTITLVALTEDNQSSDTSSTIFVGERVVQAVSFDAISLLRPDNTAWDSDGTGPDLIFFYGEVEVLAGGNGVSTGFAIGDDLEAASFPFGGELTQDELKLKFTNEDWFIQIDEVDRTNPDDVSTWDFENIINPASAQFNPLDFGTTNYETGLGELPIAGGGFVMQFFYQIVVDTTD